MKFLILLSVFLFLSTVGVLAVQPTTIHDVISRAKFDRMFPNHRNATYCDGSLIYEYQDFAAATETFGGFGTTGDVETRKREIAAFLAQTAYATAGGPEDADDPYAWGYCHLKEQNGTLNDYCVEDINWPCTPGEKYYGRGPIQLRSNIFYGRAGSDLKIKNKLLYDPEHLVKDAVLSFQSALWYWTYSHSPKPSCHDVMTNQWVPNFEDVLARRVKGFGLTTNIIDGEFECGNGVDNRVEKRIGFYKTFCDILEVSYGDHLDCYTQKPYDDDWLTCDVCWKKLRSYV